MLPHAFVTHVEPNVSQVENLGIDERLLEKWQAKRESRRGGAPRKRLVASVLAAMFAAFVRWLLVSNDSAAARARTCFRALFYLFVALVLLRICGLV